jgi:hypothetical protein
MPDFTAGRKAGVQLTSEILQTKIDQLNEHLRDERLKGEKTLLSEDLVAQIAMISEINDMVLQREIANQERDFAKENLAKSRKRQREESELLFSFNQYKKAQIEPVVQFLRNCGAEVSVGENGEIKVKHDDTANLIKVLEGREEKNVLSHIIPNHHSGV